MTTATADLMRLQQAIAQPGAALAEAVAGRYQQALPGLTRLIVERPADLGLLFVGIQVLYGRHLQEPLRRADLAQFDEWTQRYQKAAGPDRPSVAPLRSYVLP